MVLPNAFASENTSGLTLNEAIKMALERNRDLKIQELNVDKASEQLEDLEDTIKYIPDGTYIPGVSSVYGNYLLTQANERVAEKTYENMKQQIAVDVKNQYYDVLKNIKQVEVAEKALKVAETHARQARAKYDLGMLTKADLYNFETQELNAKTSLTTAKNNLETSKTKLAMLIGTSNEISNLIDDVVFEKSNFSTLENVVNKALSQRYEIWAAEHVASVTKRVQEYMDNYKVSQIDSKIKDLGAGKTKDQIEQQVETLYLSVEQMENTYETLNRKVTMLEEKLRITVAQNKVGMATNLQLQETEQAYQSALAELKQTVYLHDVAKSQLFVLTGGNILSQMLS